MSFRTVVISKRSKLDLRMGYLVVRHDSEIQRIFLDEINTLMIENPACCVTGCLLAELVDRKIKVVFCDERHSPHSELLPCHGHGESSGKLREQIDWEPAFCQKLWTAIVAEKIANQARFLEEKGKDTPAAQLRSYISELVPGDITNREGHAAKVYFNAVFGDNFHRGDGMTTDSALNYGYSIILSAFNREIVSCGFATQLGLAHRNIFNHFNLSCDLMEPFRVFIDRYVDACMFTKFKSEEKHRLLEIFNQPFLLAGARRRLDDCIQFYVRSVFRAIASQDINSVKFCSWK